MSRATFDSHCLAAQPLEERQGQLDRRLAELGDRELYRENVAALPDAMSLRLSGARPRG